MAGVLIRRGGDLETHSPIHREEGRVTTGRGWGEVAVNQGASRIVGSTQRLQKERGSASTWDLGS